MDRFSASLDLVRSSWRLLREDSKLIVFPLLSGLGTFLVLVSLAVPLAFFADWHQFMKPNGRLDVQWWMYPVAFAFYFCNYFVIVFCNSALISCAIMRFNGGTPTLSDGFQAALARLPQIAAWALVSATVGLLLKIVENANDKIGRFVSAILGTAWTVMTIFVVPVLVVEKVGPFEAIKRSTSILKKTWGENVIGGVGLGLALLLFSLPGMTLVAFGLAYFATTHAVWWLGVFVLGVAYLLACSVVGSALHGIFLSALYQYAAFGTVPSGWDADVMVQVYRAKGRQV
jgi:hypothetical protein